jgi:hypothetical protein
VTRLLGDHRQYEKAKFAVIEQAAAVLTAAMMAMVSAVMMVVGMVGICGPGRMAASAAHVSFFHKVDIYLDASIFKIYREYSSYF